MLCPNQFVTLTTPLCLPFEKRELSKGKYLVEMEGRRERERVRREAKSIPKSG